MMKKGKHTKAREAIFAKRNKAVSVAMKWLETEHYDATMHALFTNFFNGSHERIQASKNLHPGLMEMMEENIDDWVLSEATLSIGMRTIRVLDLLLGPDGPPLTAFGRDYLSRMAAVPLSLYEIQDVQKGKGLTIRDLMDDTREPVFVHDISSSESVIRWDIIGVRCVREDDTYRFYGGVYTFPRSLAMRCLDDFRKTMDDPLRKIPERTVRADKIRFYWFEHIFEPVPKAMGPDMEKATVFMADFYTVSDWPAFERVMMEKGGVKVDSADLCNGYRLTLNAVDHHYAVQLERTEDTLKVMCNTVNDGDHMRAWFEKMAGSLMRYTHRETFNLQAALSTLQQALVKEQKTNKKFRGFRTPEKAESSGPVDDPKAMVEEVMKKKWLAHYEEWLSIPLPALNEKTPLEAAKLPGMRPDLIEALKNIEREEAQRARILDLTPVDLSFVWQRLGVRPDER